MMRYDACPTSSGELKCSIEDHRTEASDKTRNGTKRNGTKRNETKWKRSSKVWTLV